MSKATKNSDVLLELENEEESISEDQSNESDED